MNQELNIKGHAIENLNVWFKNGKIFKELFIYFCRIFSQTS